MADIPELKAKDRLKTVVARIAGLIKVALLVDLISDMYGFAVRPNPRPVRRHSRQERRPDGVWLGSFG